LDYGARAGQIFNLSTFDLPIPSFPHVFSGNPSLPHSFSRPAWMPASAGMTINGTLTS
jgi:hypothetical protein